MNKALTILSTALLLTGASSAFAASSTDLTVTGIITPSACTPSLSSGGKVDHGKISAKDLVPNNPTHLPKAILQLAVNCDAPTQFALSPIDNRAGTAWNSTRHFGLNLTDADEKIGYFRVTPINVKADGVDAQPIASLDDGKTWVHLGIGGEDWDLESIWGVGAAGDSSKLIAIKDLALDLSVGTTIARADSLTLTDDVQIDGWATLQIKYL